MLCTDREELALIGSYLKRPSIRGCSGLDAGGIAVLVREGPELLLPHHQNYQRPSPEVRLPSSSASHLKTRWLDFRRASRQQEHRPRRNESHVHTFPQA